MTIKDKIRLHEDVASLKTDMEYIKAQVSNHIPTSLGKLDDRLDKIEKKLAYYAGGIIVIVFVLEVFIRLK